jgi:hypothetical protein
LQSLRHREQGIKFEDRWYCGESCFELAVREKIRELLTPQSTPGKARNSRIPLGLLLLSRGVLTPEQLRIALDQQRSTACNFGEAVSQLGYATPDQVTSAVAAQWACPVFSLRDLRMGTQVKIPKRLLDLYKVLPVHFIEKERRLMIAFVYGVHHQLLYTIGHMTSSTVAPCFITAHEFETHSSSAPELPDDTVVFEQVVDPTEIVRITRNYALQLAVKNVRIGRCCDYLWARMWGRSREMDLLFRVSD